ncbi:unnamed protein product [Candida verbasci]|uniref:UBR-type domain-containing protein n=1 Tax=Candida verbasci TaxID=1227364 RepID=A0A9W4XB92_9ASCO|nr:unnamed protein product [Candida verbasci]
MSSLSNGSINNDSETRPTQDSDSLTAVDYLANQFELEKQAKEIMPFDPNECTYTKGELRQTIFACLTCSNENNNNPIGVCYSCSIQCHSNHDLVELFTKRNFVCDCGTTRMKNTPNGACKLRRGKSNLELSADDVPSSSNTYNQNYFGKFCGCEQIYNPVEETGHMIQCYFGFTCGEDWYHDKCIMGLNPKQSTRSEADGQNLLDKLSPPGLDAGLQFLGSDEKIQQMKEDNVNEEGEENEVDSIEKLKYFPKLDSFEQYICWTCVDRFKEIFNSLDSLIPGIIVEKLPRFEGIESIEEWNQLRQRTTEPKQKKIKTENKSQEPVKEMYSIFLGSEFKEKIKSEFEKMDKSSKLYKFIENNSHLFDDDPVYQPPTDQSEEEWSTTVSYLDMCAADALHTLPKGKAIESIEAYDKIRSKLRDFFKPFAEQGKVVTEDEVKNFFGKFNEENE